MIHVLGAGSMGCLWAAHLSQQHSVNFLTTRENHPARQIFTLSKPYQETSQDYQIPIVSPSSLPEEVSTLLVCTKSMDALPALMQLKDKITNKTKLVLFQNGLGSQFSIIKHFPDNAIFAAVSTEGANRRSATEIIHAGVGLTVIGLLNQLNTIEDKQETIVTKECFELLNSAELMVQMKKDIWQALWSKLVINCAINPFTALLNCKNGEVKSHIFFKERWPELRCELSNLMQAAGYPRSELEIEHTVFDVMEKTENNISSMLQDIRAKRLTEIDDINGFASTFLKSKNLSFTVNHQLWQAVLKL